MLQSVALLAASEPAASTGAATMSAFPVLVVVVVASGVLLLSVLHPLLPLLPPLFVLLALPGRCATGLGETWSGESRPPRRIVTP